MEEPTFETESSGLIETAEDEEVVIKLPIYEFLVFADPTVPDEAADPAGPAEGADPPKLNMRGVVGG